MVKLIISIAPVFIFLTVLIFFDSYKLVKLRSILLAILMGALAGGAAWWINRWMLDNVFYDLSIYSRYVAPVIEEILKALFIFHLIKKKKVGFMVDGAIFGFAIGSGFACLENIVAVYTSANPNLLLWLIRGLGTAVMHGGTTASVAMITKTLFERKNKFGLLVILPGLLAGMVIHSFFNHFFLNPILMTLLQLIILPIIISVVFIRSEKLTQLWLEVGMDTDVLLLESIQKGTISDTKIGRYIQSLSNRFPAIVLADMLCYLRVHLELSIQAKGILILRESGFNVPAEPEIREKLKELKFLEKSIGKTGKLALAPVFHTSHHDLWQIYMVAKK